jgi:hypothetical protein
VAEEEMTDRVETPKQLATRLENVSERQIRNLIKSGELESVRIGGRIYVPADAWSLLVERKRKRILTLLCISRSLS